MTKLKHIEKYIFDFFSTRWDHFDLFYQTTYRDRHMGVYRLKRGNEIMNFLNSIHGNIEEHYYGEHLVPHHFSTPDALLRGLENFKKYLNDNQFLLDMNYDGELTSYIIHDTQRMKTELVEMIDYVKKLWDYEDTHVPYQELRYRLITRNVNEFIGILKSILASVSYAITKTAEGHYHSNVHVILKLLGFDILSEEMTSKGRIDAVIRFSDTVYIIEFKFDKDTDVSGEALEQIKVNQYPQKFLYEKKDIIAIGVSFSEKDKNINGFLVEEIKD